MDIQMINNMEPLELGKYLVQIIQTFGARLSFISECPKGYGVIKKRLGHPIKWRNSPRWYFKWPLFDTFDKVDMRKRYLQVNAHSFHSSQMEKALVPYNIIIDVQVEYMVINPLVIYDEYGFNDGEDAYTSYVNNTVQEIVSDIIVNYGVNLDYNTLNECLKSALKDISLEPLNNDEIMGYDNPFSKKYKKRHNIVSKQVKTNECVSISNIVITSFDKNISIRTTV